MRRLLLFLALLLSLPALARQKFSGTCQQAGKGITSGLATTNYLGVDYLGASVTVTVVGGGIATIYSDNSGTPLANPFIASLSDATFGFYADNGHYQIVCSGTGIPTITINSDALLNDPSVATSYTGSFFSSSTANPAQTGVLRLASADAGPTWRNNANSGDLSLTKTSGDVLQWLSGFSVGANPIFAGIWVSNTANAAVSGQQRWASTDTAKIRNNANGADLNLWSKNASDVLALGDTAGVSVQSLTNSGNSSTIGTATIGTLAVTGNSTLTGTLGVTGNSTLTTLTTSGALTASSTLAVTGATTLNGGTLNGTYAGNPTLSGTVTVSGTIATPLTVQGAGNLQGIVSKATANANQGYSAQNTSQNWVWGVRQDVSEAFCIRDGTAGIDPLCIPIATGALNILETAAPSGVATKDILYADSTAHRLKMNNNNGGGLTVAATSGDTFTTTTLTSPTINSATANGSFSGTAMRTAHLTGLSISAAGAAQGQQFQSTQSISTMGDALFRCMVSITAISAGSPFVIGCSPASATSVTLTFANGSAVQSTITAVDLIMMHD